MVNDELKVWKALADQTRRSILDYLRQKDYTVGELSNKFNITRIGVMKHLKVLERANLVFEDKKGREHWYKLNVIPIQQIYNRWIKSYEVFWASSLINLQNITEKDDEKMELSMTEIKQRINVHAGPEKVFTAMTKNISRWWGRPYIMNKESTDLILEPRIGGLFYETWGNQEGFKWGEVSYIKRNEILEITGTFGWTKAIYSKVCFTLSSTDSGTQIDLSHIVYGDLQENSTEGFETGWKELLGVRLKKFVEEGIETGINSE